MPAIKVAYLGYRAQWEADRLRDNAPPEVEIAAVPEGAQREEYEAACADADMVIPWAGSFDFEMARRCSRLTLVQALSAGADYLPVNDLAEMGVRVANNRGGNAVAVAEYAIVLMVSVYRRLMIQWRQLNEEGTYNQGFFERWEEFHELTGKRVGIVGLGQIGSRVARRLRGWECEVAYHDIAQIDAETERAANVRRLDFDELLRTSDIVSLHVPLNRTTRGMISDREFGLMKPGAVLINTCRGAVVDEAALVRALRGGTLAGAGLDVTEVEPIPADNPLIGMQNVVLTPHLAGMSIEAREKSLDFALHNAIRLSRGKEPESIVLPV